MAAGIIAKMKWAAVCDKLKKTGVTNKVIQGAQCIYIYTYAKVSEPVSKQNIFLVLAKKQ